MSDYEILRLLWWAVLGVLLIGFAVMDGFDLGAAILLPFVGRTDMRAARRDQHRRAGLGRQPGVADPGRRRDLRGLAAALCRRVLRLLPGDAAAAVRADPAAGGLQIPQQAGRARAGAATWDAALFIGGLVPALVFGVAFGNVLQGVPFRFDDTLRMTYTGTLFELFNPFALLCGLVSVAMIVHARRRLAGLQDRGPGAPARAARRRGGGAGCWSCCSSLAALGGAAGRLRAQPFAGMDAPSNPLTKRCARSPAALLANYGAHPVDARRPGAGVAGASLAPLLLRAARRAGARLRRQRARHRRRDRDRRGQPVSVHAALVARSGFQPDGLGCLVEPDDAGHHDGGDGVCCRSCWPTPPGSIACCAGR